MSLTHLHLLLNHVPVVGTVIVTLLLAWAYLRRSEEMTKASLGLIAAIGVISLIVFLTGEPAEESVENLAGFSDAITERHEEFALIATIAVVAFGAFASGALAFFRKSRMPRSVTTWSLVASLVATGMMGYTAMLGGQIRHTEVRPGFAVEHNSQEIPD